MDLNGYMSGYGLESELVDGQAPVSRFIASVDQFAIATPNTSIPLRANNTAYAVNQVVKIAGNDTKSLVCKVAGTSGGSAPSIAGAIGTRVVDGGVTWQIASRIPFSVLTTPVTINGQSVPAGMYLDAAYILNATINKSQIGQSVIDSSHVDEITADKISTGTLSASRWIQSADYQDGVAGWILRGQGQSQIPAVSILGQLTAAQIDTRGLTIKDAVGNVLFGAGTALDWSLVGGTSRPGSVSLLDTSWWTPGATTWPSPWWKWQNGPADEVSFVSDVGPTGQPQPMLQCLADSINKCYTPNAQSSTSFWFLDGGHDGGVAPTFSVNSTQGWTADGSTTYSGNCFQVTKATLATNSHGIASRAIAVTPGEVLRIRVRVRGDTATSSGLYIRINQATSMPATGAVNVANRSGYTQVWANGSCTSTYTTYQNMSYTVPAGIVAISLVVFSWGGGPLTLYVDDPTVNRVAHTDSSIGPRQDVEGGFGGARVSIDPTKTYRFVVPFRRDNSTHSDVNVGPTGNNVCNLNTSTLNTNPYFRTGSVSSLTVGRWYLAVGYVYPAGSTGMSHAGAGTFDALTGQSVGNGVNFCWPAGQSYVDLRAAQWYADNGAQVDFARPWAHVVDGTEPPLSAFLGQDAYLNSLSSTVNMLWARPGQWTLASGFYGTNGNSESVKLGTDNSFGLKPGETITLSADLWVSAAALAAGQGSRLWVSTTDSAGNWKSNAQITGTTTTPTRYSVTLTLPAAEADMHRVQVGLYHSVNTSPWTGDVYADRIKLERGAIATPFSPGVNPLATQGAPAGTMVGGTPAETVESQAANGQAAHDAVNNATTGLNSRLSRTSNEVLQAVMTVNSTYAAGIRVGDLVWNAAGVRQSGKGVAITPAGLVGVNAAGETTFSINAGTGNATFKGDISGSNGTFYGNLSAVGGTFTGNLQAVNGTFGTITAGILMNAGGTTLVNMNAAGGMTFISAGSYDSVLGQYPVEINADGSGFIGKAVASGTWTGNATFYSTPANSNIPTINGINVTFSTGLEIPAYVAKSKNYILRINNATTNSTNFPSSGYVFTIWFDPKVMLARPFYNGGVVTGGPYSSNYNGMIFGNVYVKIVDPSTFGDLLVTNRSVRLTSVSWILVEVP